MSHKQKVTLLCQMEGNGNGTEIFFAFPVVLVVSTQKAALWSETEGLPLSCHDNHKDIFFLGCNPDCTLGQCKSLEPIQVAQVHLPRLKLLWHMEVH